MSKRFLSVAALLGLGLLLGSCAAYSSFTGTVADHWPRWAGGMPNDVPPRPGAPGYEEFIAHQRAAKDAEAPAAAAEKANTRGAPASNPPANAQTDQNAVQGSGLY